MSFDYTDKMIFGNLISLNDIAEIFDSLHKTPQYSADGYNMVRVTDVKSGYLSLENCIKVSEDVYYEFTKKYKPRVGDIVISRVGSYGVFSYVNTCENFCIGQNTAIISPKIDSKYLYYCLIDTSTKQQIDSMVVGSTQKTISLKNIKSIRIPLRSDMEQKSIAHILSTLDEKIEVNNQINKTLESMAQALFKQWFIDFEFPNENGEPYKSSGGEMVESELGLIPKGWRVGELGEIGDNSSVVAKRESIPSGSRYVGLEHIPRQSLVIRESGVIDEVSSNKLVFDRQDILFGKIRPYFHKVSIVPWNGYCSTDAIVLKPKDEYYSVFAMIVFSEAFVNYAVQISHGTKMPRSEWKTLKTYKMTISPCSVAKKFDIVIRPLIQLISLNVLESARISSLRDTLLPKLMSGEIRIPIETAGGDA